MSKISKKSCLKLQSFDPKGTVFAEYTALANKYSAVNLGQGFPNIPVQDFIKQAALDAINGGKFHQYTRSEGHPRLVSVLAKYYSPLLERNLDRMTEIMTTIGASEGIYSAMQAFISPGDEVLIMQPFYDCYPASVILAGGVPKYVSMTESSSSVYSTSKDWKMDPKVLEDAITAKTKIIMINNPNNPIGKVWTRTELEGVAYLAEKYDLLVIADEVYETLVYSDSCGPMIKFASLPRMWERTITVGSMGKMLGITGWKIGWIIAPAEITRSAWLVHQYLPFIVPTPLQEAGAAAMENAIETGYFEKTTIVYNRLRDKLYEALKRVGLNPMKPDGGYFIVANIDPTSISGDYSTFLTKDVGVTSIPLRAFYRKEDASKVEKYVRFAFCKDEATLEEGARRLEKYFLK